MKPDSVVVTILAESKSANALQVNIYEQLKVSKEFMSRSEQNKGLDQNMIKVSRSDQYKGLGQKGIKAKVR